MADETKLNIGDVVELKSGGPCMTVVGVKATGDSRVSMVVCAWFDSLNRVMHEGHTFPSDAVKLVPAAPGYASV